MQPGHISVTLGLGSAVYQRRLPVTLSRYGMLRRVLRFAPDFTVLEADGRGSLKEVRRFHTPKVVNRLLWGVWRCLPGTKGSHLPVVPSLWFADRLAAAHVVPSTIFHGHTALCLACLRAAKRRGAITLIENDTLHARAWQREVLSECAHFGVHPRNCLSVMPSSLIRRREREYEMCDQILVLSALARQSFEEFGYAHKVTVILPGVDHLLFARHGETAPPKVFRVCFVGRVELAKGIGYLLEAWKRLTLPDAELLLIGPIYRDAEGLLRTYRARNVKLLGKLPVGEVVKLYRASNLLVLPSVQEGFGLVLLEAMASGLPVVATDRTGATECVTNGVDGFVIPARDVDALAEAILWCYQHADQLIAMGQFARTKVEQQFTLSHYEERLIALYRSLGS
jgi:glycosyltransferase involved in cell wall biosynthesis